MLDNLKHQLLLQHQYKLKMEQRQKEQSMMGQPFLGAMRPPLIQGEQGSKMPPPFPPGQGHRMDMLNSVPSMPQQGHIPHVMSVASSSSQEGHAPLTSSHLHGNASLDHIDKPTDSDSLDGEGLPKDLQKFVTDHLNEKDLTALLSSSKQDLATSIAEDLLAQFTQSQNSSSSKSESNSQQTIDSSHKGTSISAAGGVNSSASPGKYSSSLHSVQPQVNAHPEPIIDPSKVEYSVKCDSENINKLVISRNIPRSLTPPNAPFNISITMKGREILAACKGYGMYNL